MKRYLKKTGTRFRTAPAFPPSPYLGLFRCPRPPYWVCAILLRSAMVLQQYVPQACGKREGWVGARGSHRIAEDRRSCEPRRRAQAAASVGAHARDPGARPSGLASFAAAHLRSAPLAVVLSISHANAGSLIAFQMANTTWLA